MFKVLTSSGAISFTPFKAAAKHYSSLNNIMMKSEKRTSNILLRSIACKNFFSTTSFGDKLLLYKGQFDKRIKSLRRISAFTSIVSVAGLPLAIQMEIGQTIPIAGSF